MSAISSGAEYAVGDPAPPANQGTSPNILQWWTILQLRDTLARLGYRGIRVDQQQVTGPLGNETVAGTNKPDLQGVRNGRRVVIEVDTDPRESRTHQATITRNDPAARGVYVLIDRRTGQVRSYRTYNPATGRTMVRRRDVPGRQVRRP